MGDALTFLLILLNKKKEEIEYDWLGFAVTESNPITTYHIKRYSSGGEDNVNNCAVVTSLAQMYLNLFIANIDEDIYIKINNLMLDINKRRIYPSLEEIEPIRLLMEEFENNNRKEISAKLKILHFNEKLVCKLGDGINIYEPSNFRQVIQNGIDPVKRKVKKSK